MEGVGLRGTRGQGMVERKVHRGMKGRGLVKGKRLGTPGDGAW